ncbi:thioredoxin family protein [Streptomyces sp. NPDC017435]|uniref:thioredoxin family protein n=1 Tax=Streptomyces sp. NPDC017435 TaxID=3364995 RepID=UPI0037AC3B3B
MELTVLVVPSCPHTPLLRERLDEALADRSDVTVVWREITNPEDAGSAGMHGSPTLLFDGVDPFSPPGRPPSLSCRLGDLPTMDEIRAAITRAN